MCRKDSSGPETNEAKLPKAGQLELQTNQDSQVSRITNNSLSSLGLINIVTLKALFSNPCTNSSLKSAPMTRNVYCA